MRYYAVTPESFGQLGVFGRQIQKCTPDRIDLKVEFVRPYCVAYLDQTMLTESRARSINLTSTYKKVNRYLRQINFEHLAPRALLAKPFPQQDIIKIVRFNGAPLQVEAKVVSWLTETVKPFLPKQSPTLWKRVVENFWEITHNGIQHGGGSFGISACSQFYPMMGYFEVAFYDRGNGIPKLVRAFGAVKNSSPDCACIEWAAQKGNSTLPTGTSAGLGLHLLREFLKLNRGSIQIVSGDGYFGQDGYGQSTYLSLRNPIAGTLVNIRVVFDDDLYQLEGEDE